MSRELTQRGKGGTRGFFEELDEDFEEVSYDLPQFHPVGDQILVAFGRMVGLQRGTAIPLRQDLPLVYEFDEDGLVRSVTAYESPAEALEAAERGHADA